MKIYVSGPMTGYEELNFPSFTHACKTLRELGHEAISPHEMTTDQENYDLCLKEDLKEMLDCEMVVTLDGWEQSRGARLETTTAIHVGIPVFPIDYFIEVIDPAERLQV